MRRFTILGLMGFVLALAVGLAALRGANDYWAGGLLLATPLLFGLALIAGLCGRERPRPRRLGFAALGGIYFVLAVLGLSDENLAKLPTSALLLYVHQKVAGPTTSTVFFTALNTTGGSTGAAQFVVTQGRAPSTMNIAASAGAPVVSGVASNGADSAEAEAASAWRSLLPGAAQYSAFQPVGHCLFALLFGLLGAAFAQWFAGRPEAEPEPTVAAAA